MDTTIHLTEEVELWSNLFYKPTDTHSYLCYESSHPPHVRKALPYSQFLRIRRICSDERKFKEHCVTLKGHFSKRGYPEKCLDEAMQLATAKSSTSLLNPLDRTTTSNPEEDDVNTFFAITEYHPTQHGFRDCIEKNWDVLGSPATKKIFESKIIFGHRRPKNLREQLVRANFKSSIGEASPNQVVQRLKEKACASPGRCRYCKKIGHKRRH